ncbi:MAG: hypothetical protein HRT70_08275 [Flavobacteriaceae bacterium]|nr:hypothetical protein [Flavobacteriaceae bacterium]
MKWGEFINEIDKLKETYGANKYPEPRIEILWKKFCDLPYDSFRKCVNKFIAYEAYAPLFAKFEQELSVDIQNLKQKQLESIKLVSGICLDCNGTGISIFHEKGNETYGYAFQCRCRLGHALYPNFPKQYSGMEEKYISNRKLNRKLSIVSKEKQKNNSIEKHLSDYKLIQGEEK